ncbi:dihydrolipoyl dehydrogenase [Pelagivirga sediminicola]|uniref:Dihydrolipoyl dehydrogenase n=1 Tax=Pelagivirga sediminicola TaxID=2170575 RepID=A0A2T7G8K1_9RHOB|nr:dihydrolipoyl dehydrogenase [Pelagivirga sediminicola]PVA10727.1 dihydrolipoyl dehydrogenase [Pelagivirga sediminicola]
MMDKVDVAIIGAGTAGLAALRDVRRKTDDFVLINKRPYGTTCARVGCMPSKTLIAAANAYHERTLLDTFGIRGAENLKADIPAVMARVRELRDHFVEGVLKSTEDLGERNIAGQARLDGPNRVVVDGRTIEARQIILAPGSSPVVPKPWQNFSDRILTTDTLFEERDLPARIGVIGLGAIGAEMAQALARLGIEVHGFDGADQMAGITDEKVARTLQDALSKEFAIRLGVEVNLAEADDGVKIEWGDDSVVVDKVLVAVGRRPNVQDLGLDSLGVPLDDKGMPEVDPNTMRIGDTPVLFAGDANGIRPILHEGSDEGHIAGLNATSDAPVRLDRRTPMTVTFCAPQVASVGKSASELDLEDVLTGEVDFSTQGRARTMQQNCGLLRIYASKNDGRLLGAEMAAPAAEHMAHLLALGIKQSLTVHDLLGMPFYHPTLEEGVRSALRQIARELPPCSISDLAGCGSLDVEALE